MTTNAAQPQRGMEDQMTTTFLWEVSLRRVDGATATIHVIGINIQQAVERAYKALSTAYPPSLAEYDLVGIRRLQYESIYVKES